MDHGGCNHEEREGAIATPSPKRQRVFLAGLDIRDVRQCPDRHGDFCSVFNRIKFDVQLSPVPLHVSDAVDPQNDEAERPYAFSR